MRSRVSSDCFALCREFQTEFLADFFTLTLKSLTIFLNIITCKL